MSEYLKASCSLPRIIRETLNEIFSAVEKHILTHRRRHTVALGNNQFRTVYGQLSFMGLDFSVEDANGKEYMVDGGLSYLRRNVHEEAPYQELSMYADEPHADLREVVQWGTYGIKGDQPLTYKTIKELTEGHIKAILKCTIVNPAYRVLLSDELLYRDDPVEFARGSVS